MQPPDAKALQAEAARIGCTLGDRQSQDLLAYLALLSRWNRVYNLTAVRDEAQMSRLHLIDSLATLPALQRHADGRPLSLIDAGSGGGLPGVVIAIARPDWEVCCVDTVEKKARFIQQVALELPVANLQSRHARVERMARPGQGVDVISARAFASLADICAWTRHLLAPGGVWMAMKGRRPEAEIAALPDDIDMFHVEQLEVPDLDAERCLVWMRLRH